jgi:ribosomal protein S18 acetylase RimI-like enzyme
MPEQGVVRPLTSHEFDTLIISHIIFDRRGLIVAEADSGNLIGFAHAGFGAEDPSGKLQRLDTSLGTIAMMVLEPGLDDPEVDRGLILEAERYLRSRGAEVFYAGGQAPMNPFYWGLYGGSEFSGILSGHASFQRAAIRNGYEPAATSIVMEADLAIPEPRDPRWPILRRQTRVEIHDDTLPDGWWQSLSIGLFRPTRFLLVDRTDERVMGRATTWDIPSGPGIADGRSRTGLFDVEIEPVFRGKGFGRLLVSEVFRHARQQFAELVSVHTAATNAPALSLYESLGFKQVETSTLYRLPGQLSERSK